MKNMIKKVIQRIGWVGWYVVGWSGGQGLHAVLGGWGGEDGGWEEAVGRSWEMGEAEELEWRGVGWERGVVGGGRTGRIRKRWDGRGEGGGEEGRGRWEGGAGGRGREHGRAGQGKGTGREQTGKGGGVWGGGNSH